jgi:hypothetical protein
VNTFASLQHQRTNFTTITKQLFIASTVSLLIACGGSGGGAGAGNSGSTTASSTATAASPQVIDGRAAAIQKLLDTKPQTLEVPHGKICGARTNYSRITLDPNKWEHVVEVHVTPLGGSGENRCATFAWAPAASVRHDFDGIVYTWQTTIGRYIVDKVGDEEPGALGGKVTPFKAHFVANKLGAEFIAASIIKAPADITDGGATLHKDADGNWIAGPQ